MSLHRIIHRICYLFSKRHLSTVKAAFHSDSWDGYNFYEVMRPKLVEMKHYFEQSEIAVMDYNRIVRDIDMCIKLIDIITEKTDIWHTEGSFPNIKIVCDKYVNQRNASRFINLVRYTDLSYKDTRNKTLEERRQEVLDIFKRLPAELYREKATHLLFKILTERLGQWSD